MSIKTENLKVSIIMNCFNGEKYLHSAIESVLKQTFKNWEIIFWDNRSKDDSAKIFKGYNDARFKYHFAPKHTTLHEARNCALKKATGEFIAFLDVDDEWLPNKLEHQIGLFKDPEIGFVCSNYFVQNIRKKKKWKAIKKYIPQGKVLDDLLKYYFVGLLTLMVRRKALQFSSKPFNCEYAIIGDLDLVMRLAAKWKMAAIQEPLAIYRLHENQLSRQRKQHAQELEDWYLKFSKHAIIGHSNNFHLIKFQILYIKGITDLLSGNKKKVLHIIKKLPLGFPKIKLVIGLLLPFFLVKHIKN